MSQITQSARPADVRSGRGSARLGLVLAAVAEGGSLVAAVFVGLTLAPMQAAHGHYFSDTPTWYSTTVLILVGSIVIWTGLGIAGLVLGSLAVRRPATRSAGIIAIALAVSAPVVSFVAFTALALTTAAT